MENEYKNKNDEELVKMAESGTNPKVPIAQIEMMRRLKNSTKFSSWVMIILTIVLVIFTAILIWQGIN